MFASFTHSYGAFGSQFVEVSFSQARNHHRNNATTMSSRTRKKKESLQDKIDKKGKPMRASSRQYEHKYSLPCDFRGHPKEYGDPTCYPCGKHTIVDDHTNSCPDGCDAMRAIMDSWETRNKRLGKGGQYEKPPPISFACAKLVCAKLGVEMSDISAQERFWDVSMPLKLLDPMMGKWTTQSKTFLEVYNELSDFEKMMGMRPPLPTLQVEELSGDTAPSFPYKHKVLNTKTEAMEYLLGTAMKDGVLTQEYVNMVLENYGVVESRNGSGYDDLCQVSGIYLQEVYNEFQIPKAKDDDPNQDVITEHYEISPRLLHEHKANGYSETVPIVHSKETRLALYPEPIGTRNVSRRTTQTNTRPTQTNNTTQTNNNNGKN